MKTPVYESWWFQFISAAALLLMAATTDGPIEKAIYLSSILIIFNLPYGEQ
jgi:hypothetical protein